MRSAWGTHTVQETKPQFRPEGVPVNVRPARQAPSPAAGKPDMPAANARSQIVPERSPRPTGSTSRTRILSRLRLTWISGALAAPLAFTVVLWLTRPDATPPGVAALATATVSDATSLMAAVQTAGLRGALDLRGAVESLKRIDNERVTIKGWAVDRNASSSSLTIVAYAGGPHVLTTATNEPRKEVAEMFGLSDAAARNVSFEATFTCGSGQNLVVLAVTADRTYSQFRSLVCP